MRRRTFLGGAGLAFLGGAGALFLRRTRMVPLPPGETLQYFSPREYSIFHALAEAMIEVPGGGLGPEEIGVTGNADRFMARNVPDAQADIHRLLALFDNALAGFLLTGTTAPFSQLSLEARRDYLRRWERHSLAPIRSGFVALKRLAMSCYYSDPRTYRGVGYPGPPVLDAASLPPTPPPPWRSTG